MEKQFLIVRESDGFILGVSLQPSPDAGPIVPQTTVFDGYTLIEHAAEFTREGRRDPECAYLRGDVVVWSDPSTLEQAHEIAWEAVKVARDAAEAAPFEFEGGMYDPNKENITGAALAAFMAQMAGVTISRRWTLADNSRRTLAGPQLIDLGYKLTTRIDAIHETGRRLRDQLETIKNTPGATPADLYAVTWPTEENNAVE